MKKVFLLLILVSCVLFNTVNAQAGVLLFNDDFTGSTINSAKWSIVDGYGSVSQNNEAIFTIVGNGTGNPGIHLQSSTIDVSSSNINEVVFSGLWRVAGSTYTAEPDIYIVNAGDPTKYIRVGYSTWNDALDFSDTTLGSSIANYSRGHNTTNLPFAFHVNGTGWTYEENGTVLRDITSNWAKDVDSFYIKIGGWDYSIVSDQLGYFDDININADVRAIPEPASMSLLGLGLMGLVGVARKRKEA